jgi:hypothetical protein
MTPSLSAQLWTACCYNAALNAVAAVMWFTAALVCGYWLLSCSSRHLGKELLFVMATFTYAQLQTMRACA